MLYHCSTHSSSALRMSDAMNYVIAISVVRTVINGGPGVQIKFVELSVLSPDNPEKNPRIKARTSDKLKPYDRFESFTLANLPYRPCG